MGLALIIDAIMDTYENVATKIREIIPRKAIDFMVVDMFTTPAIDVATQLNVPYAVVYHCAIFGFKGIQDTFSHPDFIAGTSLADRTFLDRVRRVIGFVSFVKQLSPNTARLNGIREKLGLPQYMDPTTNINSHPLISFVTFGFEYAKVVSPLVKTVGFFVTHPKAVSSTDQIILDFLSRLPEKEAVLATFGTEAFPTKDMVMSMVDGAREGGYRLVMAVRTQCLTRLGITAEELQGSDGEVIIVPWVQQTNILKHPQIKV